MMRTAKNIRRAEADIEAEVTTSTAQENFGNAKQARNPILKKRIMMQIFHSVEKVLIHVFQLVYSDTFLVWSIATVAVSDRFMGALAQHIVWSEDPTKAMTQILKTHGGNISNTTHMDIWSSAERTQKQLK